MTKKRIIFILALSLSVLFPAFASADLIIPENEKYKKVDYCFEIDNIAEYEEYVFILSGILIKPEIIKAGNCLHLYANRSPRIYAVKKEDFVKLNEEKPNFYMYDNTFENIPGVIKASKSFLPIASKSKNSPVSSVRDIFHIEEEDEGNISVRKNKIVYYYENGFKEEKFYTDQNSVPLPSNKIIALQKLDIVWFFALPAIAALLISLIIFKKRKTGI